MIDSPGQPTAADVPPQPPATAVSTPAETEPAALHPPSEPPQPTLVEPVVIQQEGGGQIQFPPAAAQLHGALSLENIATRDAIVGWASSADRAVWRFHLTRPGPFHLRLEYASAAAETIGSYEVRVGDQSRVREVRSGEGSSDPVADAFPLAFSRGGDYELEIVPQRVEGTDLFTLYSVELSPVRAP